MASACKQTSTVRNRKLKTRGKAAKNARRNAGTTLARAELFKVKA
jgi:hypothetical protein